MGSHSVQDTPQVDQAFSIQVQCFDSGTACLCKSQYIGTVIVPGEVVSPAMLSRVVQRRNVSAYRVVSFCLYGLVSIASLAGKSQVF
jgi:hypothetical protein